MKILAPYNPHNQHITAGKLIISRLSNYLLIFIFLITGCGSPSLTEFKISIDDKTYKKSPVISQLNREEGNLIKINLEGYVPYSTRAEFKDRQWMFANLKFGKQILIALDINTGYLYKLLPQHMSDLLQEENETAVIEQDVFYLMIVQNLSYL